MAELVNYFLILVHANYVVAGFGQAYSDCQSYVAGSDYSYSHLFSSFV